MSVTKRFTILMVFVSLMTPGVQASEFAPGKKAEIEALGTPMRKLQRGFLNIALSPLEVSHEMEKKEKASDMLLPHWFIGAIRGGFFAASRAIVGVYEILTFAFPFPSGYEPLIEPEFSWEHLPTEEEKSKR